MFAHFRKTLSAALAATALFTAAAVADEFTDSQKAVIGDVVKTRMEELETEQQHLQDYITQGG